MITFKFDNRQFNAVLKAAVMESHRSAQDIINSHALYVAAGAAANCKVANKDQIAQTLGQLGNELNFTKAGKLRKGKRAKGKAVLDENSFAARIVNARRREFAGKDFMLWGEALTEAARKLIRARQNAVGFIASGFVRAARQLQPFVKGAKPAIIRGFRVIAGGPGGKGKPAKAGGGIFGSGKYVATVENDVVVSGGKFQAPGKSFNPGPIAESALRKSLEKEQGEMLGKLKISMTEAMRKAGAL